MITIETIGVGSKEDFQQLERLLERERMEYSVYYEDYDPTPYNAIVRAHEGRILKVLNELDSLRIYYETTMRLPTVGG
jgi:hypothetical protein